MHGALPRSSAWPTSALRSMVHAPPPANVPGEDADYANILLSEVIDRKVDCRVQVRLHPVMLRMPSPFTRLR